MALGFALSLYLGQQIRSRSQASTQRAVVLATDLGITPQFNPRALASGQLPKPAVRRLNQAIASLPGSKGQRIVRVQIWNRDRQVVYRSDAPRGAKLADGGGPSDELIAALSGTTASEVLSAAHPPQSERDVRKLLRRHGDLMEVYVPIKSRGRTVGAFEVYLQNAATEAAIAQDTNRLYLVILVGLSVLYAVVFRMVAAASRRLRDHADELRRHAERSERESLHDRLTGLPNRTLLRDRAHQAIIHGRRTGEETALLLIDLDSFKEINDTLGHHSGDTLLREVGIRLTRVLRESDTVARLGGDEFGILLPEVGGESGAVTVARAVHRALQHPFPVQGLMLDVEGSIGIALLPTHADSFDELMQRADIAMYAAKGRRTGYEVYVPESTDGDRSRLKLASELRDAVARGEVVLHYQPKCEMRGGRVTGAEALMRWYHPTHGAIAPDRFIPLAERSGLIRSLTMFAIESAIAECRRWIDDGVDLTVSVNLSTRDLIDVQLPDDIARLLGDRDVPADRLELEITESVIMADPLRARGVVSRLRDMGVHVAIDDFGSGYSSLGYLKRLPVNELKIDKSFVLGMTEDEGDGVIVQSTIDLAHNLGLRVVAEGVETQEVWERLRAMGCDIAQGYLISRAMAGSEFRRWLENSGRSRSAA